MKPFRILLASFGEKKDLFILLVLLVSLPILTIEVDKQKRIASNAQEENFSTLQNKTIEADGIIIKYKKGVDEEKKIKIVQEKNIDGEMATLEYTDISTLQIPKEKINETIEKLEENSEVEYAEPDFRLELYEVPNDPNFSKQWYLSKINSPQAWDITRGSSSINIAIINAGVSLNHSDLSSKIIKRGLAQLT